MRINEKIKAARLSKKWTQDQIANAISEKRTTYAEWERETIPTFDVVVKISSVTGMPISEFIAAVDDKMECPEPLVEKPAKRKFDSADYLAGKLESSTEMIQHIEARRKDAETLAQKMEAHYNDMKNALERAQTTINEVLKPIKEQTSEILTNSKAVQEGLQVLKTEIVAENGEMMEVLDQIAGNEPGTTAAKAGTVELAHRVRKNHKDKKVDKRT